MYLYVKLEKQKHEILIKKPFHLVQILKALSQNLRQKSNAYDDSALAFLFMLNNLQYIGQTVSRERNLLTLVQNDQTTLPATFELEAENCLQHFLKGWARVGEVFNADLEAGDEKRSVKSIFTVMQLDFIRRDQDMVL